ncbi:MAG: nuclear transport factor 2 family protein [Halobacteriales archaeon]
MASDPIEARLRSYYETLRAGEPLAPFFADRPNVVKFGISERLTGGEAVAAGLRAQTETTTEWDIESRRLITGRDGDTGWFSDDVGMAWTDTDTGDRLSFDSRWSGTLIPIDGEWRFVGMHVSVANEF